MSNNYLSDAALEVIEKALPAKPNVKFRVGLIKRLAEEKITDIQTQEQDGLTYFLIDKEQASFPTSDDFHFHRVIEVSQDGLSISVSFRNPSVNYQSKVEEKLIGMVRDHMKIPEKVEGIALEQRLVRPKVPAWCSKGSSSKIVTLDEYTEMLSNLNEIEEQPIVIEVV